MLQLIAVLVTLAYVDEWGRDLVNEDLPSRVATNAPIVDVMSTAYDPRIDKTNGGYVISYIHFDGDAYNLNFQISGAALTENITPDAPTKTLCRSTKFISKVKTCAPPSGDGVHFLYQVEGQWRHQVVEIYLNSDFSSDGWVIQAKGGFCGEGGDWNVWNNATAINPTDTRLDLVGDMACPSVGTVAMTWRKNYYSPSSPLYWYAYNFSVNAIFNRYPIEGFGTSLITSGEVSNPNQFVTNPKMTYTGIANYVIVWGGNWDNNIFGQVYDGNGAEVSSRFEVTAGMSRPGTKFLYPEVIPDRFGAGFIVVWQELSNSDMVLWMREFDGNGVPAADNPHPHVLWRSAFESGGMRPVGTATYGGQVWVSFVKPGTPLVYSLLADFNGTIYEHVTSTTGFPVQPEYRDYIELSQATYGIMCNGFAVTTSSGFDKFVVVNYLDYFAIYGGPLEVVVPSNLDYDTQRYMGYFYSLEKSRNPMYWVGPEQILISWVRSPNSHRVNGPNASAI
eukprot:TRINITY_DN13826_c0_g2_i1.p1 TRINITY_DN13826_c0_g2~~TRINITY_DN13826_c0_g2_i1.p1  ORF type:complete len:506 (+),score=64.41 TRINITY_DN13826_c0_g2_i1:105-1622(+)